MIFDITITLDTSSVSVTSTDDIDIVITLDAEQIPPASICEQIDDCLGISASGSANKYLNEQGNWVSVTGGSVIEKTKAEFLALVSGSTLQFPAVYKIIDIKNGLFVETLSANTFKSEASLSFLAPDYTLHGQYHTTDGAVANNAIVTWGGFYWQNTSGGSSTPNVPDEAILDDTGDFTQISKSIANGYVEVVLSVIIKNDLSIEIVTDNNNNTVNNFVLSFFGLTYENTAINNNAVHFNNGWAVTNCRGDMYAISENKAINTPIIKRCNLPSGARIANNEGVGTLDVTYIENSTKILGQHFHLSYIKDINIVGGSTIDESDLNNLSWQENISITGDGNFIASAYFDSSSFEKNITIVGNNNEFNSREFIYDSGIDNFDIQCNGFLFDNVRLTNGSVLSNFATSTNGRTISDLVIASKSIDLTGFDRDIIGERIEGGNGWFTITHNFATSNLASGSSLLLNLIPNGARLTMLSASGTLTGTNIEIGLETDDEAIISGAVGLLPLEWSGASLAATANRSLKIKATGGNITGGTLTVKVEFVV